MKTCTRAGVVIVALLLSFSACSSTSTDDYIDRIREQADQYNSARDVVDKTIRAVDFAATLREGMEAAKQGIPDLERAILEMDEAYKALGNKEVPEKYQEHQQATLSAWRAGMEATTTVRLYLAKVLTTGEIDDTLVLAANRLFGEEDRYQLEARRALQAAR